jgi:large subunit ribosomal protein L3
VENVVMSKGLIGKKVGMTQVFTEEGNFVPVTVVDVSSCIVVGKRTPEKDKYSAVTLGFGEVKEKSLTRAMAGVFKKNGAALRRHLKEFRISAEEAAALNVGDPLKADLFQKGQRVDVTGTTKGRGFQGGVKRFGWSGGDATHGSMFHRAPGSIGASSDPSRVWPGHRLPGRMGGVQRTVLNLSVVRVMPEQNLVLLRGAVPGPNGSLVLVRKSVKTTKAQQKAGEKK